MKPKITILSFRQIQYLLTRRKHPPGLASTCKGQDLCVPFITFGRKIETC